MVKTGSLPLRSGVAGKVANQAHDVSRLGGERCALGPAGRNVTSSCPGGNWGQLPEGLAWLSPSPP